MRLIIAVVIMSGCAIFRETPPTFGVFSLHPEYHEIQADPGRVADEYIGGEWSLCGFVNFIKKQVWLSRDMNCDWAITRPHEACHIEAYKAGVTDWHKDGCHKKFKPQTPVDPWVRQLGR